MKTMKYSVVPLVFVLAVNAVSGQSGQSGGQKCVEGAERNGAGLCVCKDGFLGEADFCCIPDDHKMCMVEGDPIVTAMNGDTIPLDLPCVTMVSEVHTVGPVIDETVHVYVAGQYGRNGILNFDSFRVEYWERYNNLHTEIEISGEQLTINGASHNRSTPWSSSKHEVEMVYNPDTGRYVMKSMGTTMVYFTPPSARNQQPRSGIPGVCVGVARDSLLYDVGICNQRRRGLQRSSFNKGFPFLQTGVVEHTLRRLPVSQNFGSKEVHDNCKAIHDSRRPCGGRWNPAFKACYVLVANSTIRYCLAKQNVDILNLFKQCIAAHCHLGGGNNSCAFISSKTVKTCVELKPDCNTFVA